MWEVRTVAVSAGRQQIIYGVLVTILVSNDPGRKEDGEKEKERGNGEGREKRELSHI